MLDLRMLEHKLPENVVHDIIRRAVDVERQLFYEALSCDLIGMNNELRARHIEFVADRLLTALGLPKLSVPRVPFRLDESFYRTILSRAPIRC